MFWQKKVDEGCEGDSEFAEPAQRSAAQRRRERRAEESRAEAEATVEQIRRHHRSIGSLFSRGAATVTISANAEGVAPARAPRAA
jgi:hypothetical protein